MHARVSVDETTKGMGFAIGPTTVLTARHVVRDALDGKDIQRPDAKIKLVFEDRSETTAVVAKCDSRLDVAVLELKYSVTGWLRPQQATQGAEWRIRARPCDTDPVLSGTVTACRHPLRTAANQEAVLLQLYVREDIGDYQGYSGSAIESGADYDNAMDGVVGVVIEQGRWRVKRPGERQPFVANILYGAPVEEVVQVLGLGIQVSVDQDLLKFKRRMEKIRAAAPEVSEYYVKEMTKEVLHAYVWGDDER
jgi:hypothetical protein